MNLYKKISIRLLALLGVYLALLMCSKIVSFDTLYNQHFINKGNYLFSNFGNGGEVEFMNDSKEKKKSISPKNECSIQLTSKQQKREAIQKAKREGKLQIAYHPIKISINTWDHFGVLFLFFISCIVVLPIAFKYKVLVSVISYLFVELYFYIKVWAKINLEFSKWFDQFKVGWENNFLVDLLNYFHLIISFPFFGLMFIFFSILFLSKRFIEQNKYSIV